MTAAAPVLERPRLGDSHAYLEWSIEAQLALPGDRALVALMGAQLWRERSDDTAPLLAFVTGDQRSAWEMECGTLSVADYRESARYPQSEAEAQRWARYATKRRPKLYNGGHRPRCGHAFPDRRGFCMATAARFGGRCARHRKEG